MSPRAQPLRYRPDIDGLRAIAVSIVVLFHAFPNLLPGGFIGVDVFFVISGYLITGIVSREVACDKFSFINFYAKRIRRLVPSMFTVLLATLIIGWYVLLADEFKSLAKHVVAASTFVSNILLWKEVGYFDVAADLKPLLHFWSLGIEEQFYFLWPILLVLCHKRRWRITHLINFLLLSSFIYCLWRSSYLSMEAFYLLPSRFWELLLGGALSYYERTSLGNRLNQHRTLRVFLNNNVLSMIAIFLILFGAYFIRQGDPYPGWWSVLPCLGAFLAIAAGPNAWLNRIVLANRLPVFIGRISYPLYLWHWPLLVFARISEEQTPNPWVRFVVVIVSFFLASMTWLFIEKPIQNHPSLKLTSQRSQRICLVFGCSLLAFLCGLSLFIYKKQGFPERNAEKELLVRQKGWSISAARSCSAEYGLDGDSYCNVTTKTPELLILGDSHSTQLVAGLALEEGGNRGVLQLGRGNCPALTEVDRKPQFRCLETFQKLRDGPMKDYGSTTKIGIIAAEIPWHFGDPEKSNSLEFFSTISAEKDWPVERIFEEGLSRTISELEALGKTVIFVIDLPILDFDPWSCFETRPWTFTKRAVHSCELSYESVKSYQKAYRRVVDNLKMRHPDMIVFDLVPLFCDKEKCTAKQGNLLLYRDPGHLTREGSLYVGRHLNDEIVRMEGAKKIK